MPVDGRTSGQEDGHPGWDFLGDKPGRTSCLCLLGDGRIGQCGRCLLLVGVCAGGRCIPRKGQMEQWFVDAGGMRGGIDGAARGGGDWDWSVGGNDRALLYAAVWK